MAVDGSTIHASAVLIGARAVLIRGPSGSGKSRLAFALLDAAQSGRLPFARLVSDDRTQLIASHGRLIARPAETLQGLLELRGLGIRKLAFEPLAVVGLVVDLAAGDAARLPPHQSRQCVIAGINVARLAVAPDSDPLPPVIGLVRTEAMAG
jgi:HPr kinase/phosphorylase